MQAGYNGGCDQGFAGDGASPCGPTGGCIQQAGMFGGSNGCMRPGSTEAYADGGATGGMATSQIAFLGDDGVQVSWDIKRLWHVRFDRRS